MRKIAAFVFLVSCSVATFAASDVTTSEKPGINFSQYETYYWKISQDEHPDSQIYPGAPLDLRIRGEADKHLASTGLQRVESEEADLWINYVAYGTDQLDIEGYTKKLGGGVAWIGDPQAHSMRSYREGTVVFEIVDPATGQMIWSGWASEAAPNAEKLQKKAEKLVRRIIRNYPPD